MRFWTIRIDHRNGTHSCLCRATGRPIYYRSRRKAASARRKLIALGLLGQDSGVHPLQVMRCLFDRCRAVQGVPHRMPQSRPDPSSVRIISGGIAEAELAGQETPADQIDPRAVKMRCRVYDFGGHLMYGPPGSAGGAK